MRQRFRVGDAERCAGGVESLSAAAIGKYAEMADSVEPGWQHMGHEPGNERLGGEGFHPISGLALSQEHWSAAPEPHGLSIKVDDAAVADGDAVGIARQICENLPCALKRSLGKDNPVLAPRLGNNLAEFVRIRMTGLVPEDNLTPVMGFGEVLQKAAAEETGENFDRSEEASATGLPFAGFNIEPGIGDNAVQVGMPQELLVPCMQNSGTADTGAAPARIGGDRAERLGGGPEQNVEHRSPVVECDSCNLARQGEDDVKAGHGQDVVRAGFHPLVGRGSLTCWTVPVPAGVVSRMLTSAPVAQVQMAPEGGGAARLDGGHDL